MNIHDILQALPQRFPFLMIDQVIEIVPGQRLVAIKNVTINEPYFNGHFPGNPVMPGVMILEALAQAGAILAYKSMNQKPEDGIIHLFAGIDNARFKRPVLPGDQLRLEVETMRVRATVRKVQGIAYVADEIACSAELMSATSKI